jgi:hypothetical protein
MARVVFPNSHDPELFPFFLSPIVFTKKYVATDRRHPASNRIDPFRMHAETIAVDPYRLQAGVNDRLGFIDANGIPRRHDAIASGASSMVWAMLASKIRTLRVADG